MTKHIFIGIDVSEDTLDVWIHPLAQYKTFANNSKGINELVTYIQPLSVAKIVVEATGGLEYKVAHSLQKAGYLLAVVNPCFTAAFRTVMGKFTKTDATDANMLALFAEKMDPVARDVPNALEKELKELTSRRNQLITMIVSERNRLRRTDNNTITESIEKIIHLLEAQKHAVEARMLLHIQQVERYKNIYDLLISIPGIGSITAVTLIIELPELGMLNSKQISSLAGVAPHLKESGKIKSKAKIQGGRRSIRAALYMSAITAARCNPAIKPFYDRLVQEGKAKKLAIIAVMRKLVIIINTLVKEQRAWKSA
jgi:transposase